VQRLLFSVLGLVVDGATDGVSSGSGVVRNPALSSPTVSGVGILSYRVTAIASRWSHHSVGQQPGGEGAVRWHAHMAIRPAAQSAPGVETVWLFDRSSGWNPVWRERGWRFQHPARTRL
jgi:hypothetical protein